MIASRKYETIDLLKLRSQVTNLEWNSWLTRCLKDNDVEGLKKTRYGLQCGMDKLVKDKMSDEKLVIWFIRLMRSTELTMKKILVKLYPSPHDDPTHKAFHSKEAAALKRKRDAEFEIFLRETSF